MAEQGVDAVVKFAKDGTKPSGFNDTGSQLVTDKLGYKYHWAVADYLQRAARHIASKVDVAQAYAVGKAAVDLALQGHNSVMPTIVRISNRPYRWKIGVAKVLSTAKR